MEENDAERPPDCWPHEAASTVFRLRQGGPTWLTLLEGHCAARGAVLVNDSDIAREAQFVLLNRTGGEVTLEANDDARC
jgi:hypothetical protein